MTPPDCGYQRRKTVLRRESRRRRARAACREQTPEQWPGYDERVMVPLFLMKQGTNDGVRYLLARKKSELANELFNNGCNALRIQAEIDQLRSVM